MIRLAGILALVCGPALSQEIVRAGGDVIEMRESETHFAEVFYSNSPVQNSKIGEYRLSFAGTSVLVVIEFGSGKAERVTVSPEDPSFVAVPADAEVEDGQSVVIQIMQPMF